jgi:hypothetical protein
VRDRKSGREFAENDRQTGHSEISNVTIICGRALARTKSPKKICKTVNLRPVTGTGEVRRTASDLV